MTSIAPGNRTVDPPRRSRALSVPGWLPRPTRYDEYIAPGAANTGDEVFDHGLACVLDGLEARLREA